MCNRTLKIGDYTVEDNQQVIHIYNEEGVDIDSTDVTVTLEDFDKYLDCFLQYFSKDEIDDIIKWYFDVYIGEEDYFSFEEETLRNKLKVIRYLKTRELEKYIQSISSLSIVDVVTEDYCTILSRDKYLCAEYLAEIEDISNFTLKRIKENEYGVRYTFERGDGL